MSLARLPSRCFGLTIITSLVPGHRVTADQLPFLVDRALQGIHHVQIPVVLVGYNRGRGY